MFSKACEYGIRALTVIAKKTEDGSKVGIKDICKASNTPESFTAKILQNLAKKDIIQSQKGPSGGFYIDRDLSEISLYDIVEAIDGPSIFFGCGLGLKECDASRPCPMHDSFESVRDDMLKMCKENDLQSLITGLNKDTYQR